MGQKIKHRQERKPRNHEVVDMLVGRKGGPMRDERDKRSKREHEWKQEIRDSSR